MTIKLVRDADYYDNQQSLKQSSTEIIANSIGKTRLVEQSPGELIGQALDNVPSELRLVGQPISLEGPNESSIYSHLAQLQIDIDSAIVEMPLSPDANWVQCLHFNAIDKDDQHVHYVLCGKESRDPKLPPEGAIFMTLREVKEALNSAGYNVYLGLVRRLVPRIGEFGKADETEPKYRWQAEIIGNGDTCEWSINQTDGPEPDPFAGAHFKGGFRAVRAWHDTF